MGNYVWWVCATGGEFQTQELQPLPDYGHYIYNDMLVPIKELVLICVGVTSKIMNCII